MRSVVPMPLLAVALFARLAAAADLDAAGHRLEQALIAPCCFHHTVAEHRSPESDAMRVEIRRRLAAGETEAALLAAYEQRYGERILAAPHLAGFGLLAWGTPWVALAAAAGLLWRWLCRHRPARPAAAAPAGPTAELDARLAAEFARLDA